MIISALSRFMVVSFVAFVLSATAQGKAVVTTLPPTNVTHDGATLNGTINANGDGTNVYIDFGTTTAVSQTLYITYTNDDKPQAVSEMLSSLTQHQAYYYRVRTVSGNVTVKGATIKFIASDQPVAVTDTKAMLPSTKTVLDVLANDTDGDGDPLSIASFTQPGAGQGVVSKVGNTLLFTAAPSFSGGSFSYIASDAFGGRSNAGVVNLTLDPCTLTPAQSLALAPTAQTIDVAVSATQPWLVLESLPWVKASPTAGTGNGTVTLTLMANTTTSARFGDVVIGGIAHHLVQESSLAPTTHLDPMTVPHAIISGTYQFVVPIAPQSAKYVVTGLPKGLTMDNLNHKITGLPQEVGADKGTAHVTVKGTAETVAFDLVVEPLPALAQGSFSAIITRDLNVTGDLGGFVTFTVTGTGAVTGSLKVGQLTLVPGIAETKTYPFKTQLEVPLSGNPSLKDCTITRKGMASLVLNISTVDITAPGTGDVAGSLHLATLAGVSTSLAGRRTAWTPDSAAPYVANYTAALTPPTLVSGTPDGSGYLTMKVAAKTAVATWTGQLADGTAYTGSGALWDTGAGTAQVPIWLTLNSSQAVLTGLPELTPQSLPDLTTLLGSVSWRKKPQTTRAYKDGFDTTLDVLGTRYTLPDKGSVVLGLPPPTADYPYNASIAFMDGGIEDVEQIDDLAQLFGISTANKAIFDTVDFNPTLMKITSINVALGTFTGSLKLTDANLLLTPATITRDVKFSGVLLPGASPASAIGYFLLPARPAVLGETVNNTALTSGTVAF